MIPSLATFHRSLPVPPLGISFRVQHLGKLEPREYARQYQQ